MEEIDNLSPDEDSNPDWIYELEGWSLASFRDWWGLRIDMSDPNTFIEGIDRATDFMSRCIKKWPFSGDPTIVGSYNYLTLEEWVLAFLTTSSALGQYFRQVVEDMATFQNDETEQDEGYIQ